MSLASITKESAWTIFKSISLGQRDGAKALARLTKGEAEAYDCWKEDFELAIAKVGAEAQNEAARIQAENPELIAALGETPMNRWNAAKYTQAVSMFKGAKFEQLHLAAMFRISNNELLLELAKPES